MNKFKPGDIVIKVKAARAAMVKIGTIATVIEDPHPYHGVSTFCIRMQDGEWWRSDPRLYEYYIIHDSPLMKVLK